MLFGCNCAFVFELTGAILYFECFKHWTGISKCTSLFEEQPQQHRIFIFVVHLSQTAATPVMQILCRLSVIILECAPLLHCTELYCKQDLTPTWILLYNYIMLRQNRLTKCNKHHKQRLCKNVRARVHFLTEHTYFVVK